LRRGRGFALLRRVKTCPSCWLAIGLGSLLLAVVAGSRLAANGAEPPTAAELARDLVLKNEPLWRSCAAPPESLSSRALFSYAFALAEAGLHPERLDRLLALAAQMQDRDPTSRQFGNFRWYWRDAKVMDANAVDFCMRGGALLWLKHREFVPPSAREPLRELLKLGVQGSLRHKVQPSYSNIALMNAGNLILLGEALDDAPTASEGYARLDRFFSYTRTNGSHEFVSPTYTGVDLDGLVVIEAFCREQRGRTQARALLELFWTDVALNWFPPAQRLAGAHSRTYDFLRGLGYLDVQLTLNGWITAPPPRDPDALYAAQAKWHPPAALRAAAQVYPRLVRQSWGEQAWHSRTHYLLPDITLSSSASSYGGRMDMPLTVDLPGPRTGVRGYFLADGREDPYGKNKIAAGPHQKAFHLDPFWAAAQRETDALGLVIYRDQDIPTNAVVLNSNFVLPLDADEFRVGTNRAFFVKGQPSRIPLEPGHVVSLRKGAAALGLRVPWVRGTDSQPAPTALVFDGNEFGAVRLVVEHAPAGHVPATNALPPGAVFWLRIGSGLRAEAAFAAWLKDFAAAAAKVEARPERIRVQVASQRGPVEVVAAAPWSKPEKLEPAPRRAVLELNGEDVGGRILARVGQEANR